jgi:hypothetical protein
MRFATSALVVTALALHLTVAMTAARTWHVVADGTGDVPTIQTAIDSAASGDEIVVGPGTYTWANQGSGTDYGLIRFLRGRNGITMRSEAGAAATVLDAQQQGRVIYLQGYNTVAIEGFTITGGKAPLFGDLQGGGIIAHLCPAVFRDCVITGNSAARGGGLWCGGWSSMQFLQCTFEGNWADYGAGMYFINSVPTPYIYESTIKLNIAAVRGGGVYAYNNALTFESSVLAGNTAGERGGGLYANAIHPSSMARCTVSENRSEVAGGGIYMSASSDLTMTGSIVAFSGKGGGLWVDPAAPLTIGCSDIYGNAGGDGIPAHAVDTGGNFSLDPRFCGERGSFDFAVRGESPCASGNHPGGMDCGQIGARTAGCGGVEVETRSWGAIKALYRDR